MQYAQLTIGELRSCREMEFQCLKQKDQIDQLKAKLRKIQDALKQTTLKYYCYHNQIMACKKQINNAMKKQSLPNDNLLLLIKHFLQKNQRQNSMRSNNILQSHKKQIQQLKASFQQINKKINILSKQNIQLNNINIDLEIKLQNFKNNQRQTQNYSFQINLLFLQKELYARVTSQICHTFKRSPLNQMLMQILKGCQQITHKMKKKLQIEQQLQKYQQNYQKQLINKGVEKYLIQQKRKIQGLRQQLFQIKSLLHNQEQQLQNKLGQLLLQEQKQTKLKNYSIALTQELANKQPLNFIKQAKKQTQKKLMNSKQIDKITKYQEPTYTTHGNTPQAIMEELAKQDRQQIEKMFSGINRFHQPI